MEIIQNTSGLTASVRHLRDRITGDIERGHLDVIERLRGGAVVGPGV